MATKAAEKKQQNDEAEERKLPSAAVVFEAIRKEGEGEIERTAPAPFF